VTFNLRGDSRWLEYGGEVGSSPMLSINFGLTMVEEEREDEYDHALWWLLVV